MNIGETLKSRKPVQIPDNSLCRCEFFVLTINNECSIIDVDGNVIAPYIDKDKSAVNVEVIGTLGKKPRMKLNDF